MSTAELKEYLGLDMNLWEPFPTVNLPPMAVPVNFDSR